MCVVFWPNLAGTKLVDNYNDPTIKQILNSFYETPFKFERTECWNLKLYFEYRLILEKLEIKNLKLYSDEDFSIDRDYF